MLSRWNDADAARDAAGAVDAALGTRAYSSRLLGAEKSLVLHGGGNTSFKRERVLYVKGSGSDLAKVRESDFSALDLDQVLALQAGAELDNDALRRSLASTAVHPGPAASIESLMHALLPWPFVEHTHADAVLAVTNTVNGARIASDLFGELAPLVPFHPSGFALARACAEVFHARATEGTIGLILHHHGVVAFGRSARESYENMLRLVTRAEDYLKAHGAWQLPRDPRPFEWEPIDIARLRARLSRAAGHPLLLTLQEGAHWQAFARRPDLGALCAAGPATPQHAVFLRAQALAGTDIEAFVARYAAAVHAAHPSIAQESPGFDYAPRLIIDPALGTWVAGIDPVHLRIAQDVLEQDLEIKTRASSHDRYAGLPVAENIDAEIHYGGFEQRLLASGGPGTRLLGQAVLIDPAADEPGLPERYAAAGAAVLQSPPADPALAVREAVRRFGGIDVLVTCTAEPSLLNAAAPVLACAPRGGRVVPAGAAADSPRIRQRCAELELAVEPALGSGA